QIGGPLDGIPIYYLDPDKMSDFATNRTFRPVLDRGAGHTHDSISMIVANNDSSYRAYTTRRQLGLRDPININTWLCRGWGSFMDSKTSDGTGQGATVTTLARAVTAAKFRYPRTFTRRVFRDTSRG